MDNKKELQALLEFIDKLCEEPQNAWFKKELIKRFSSPLKDAETSSVSIGDQEERIKNIESYLALDYNIDYADSIIDYSWVQDAITKTKLIADNREMLRYRLNCRSHKADFIEFCRYAHFQAESLINYFYSQRFSTMANIIQSIQTYNNFYNPDPNILPKKVGDIPYRIKLIAIEHELHLSYDCGVVLDNVRAVRNNASHRAGSEEQALLNYYQKNILSANLPVKDMDFDTYAMKDNMLQKNLCETFKCRNKNSYDEYKVSLWVSRAPFDEVVSVLAILAEKIKAITPNS